MFDILKSIFGKPREEIETVWSLLSASSNAEFFDSRQLEYIEFFQEAMALTNESPTETAFLSKFSDEEEVISFSVVSALPIPDARLTLAKRLQEKRNIKTSEALKDISSEILDKGLTSDLETKLARLRVSSSFRAEAELTFDYVDVFSKSYAIRASTPDGIKTFIPDIDEFAGGMTPGSLNTIMGYSGHFKSSMASNIAYCNAFYDNKKVCFVSLELTREEVLFNMLCRHSLEEKFDKYAFIPHDKIRKGRLTEEEKEYLDTVVAPDFTNPSGGGKFVVLETADFSNLSYSTIQAKMEEVDEKVGPIDLWLFDHIQMLKFSSLPEHRGMSELAVMDGYCNQMMKWALNFRGRKTTVILLAQTNRDGLKHASKREGRYEANALAEVNEAYRAATRVMSVYASDEMKELGEANVMVIKARNGRTTADPIPVFIKPEAYMFGISPENLKSTPSTSAVSMAFSADLEFDF